MRRGIAIAANCFAWRMEARAKALSRRSARVCYFARRALPSAHALSQM
jgi:hypothetical protein